MLGPWQIAIVIILFVVLFGGKGKISSVMGDMAGGIKAFKKGMSEDDEAKQKDAETASLTDTGETPVETPDQTKTP